MPQRLAPTRPRRRPLTLACSLALLAAALTACGSTESATLDTLPDGVSIAVYQSRLDASERKYEIAVTNDSEASLTVTSLELSTPAFAAPMPYDRLPTVIDSGRTIDFRVPLAPPDCDAADTSPTVTIAFEHAGRSGAATVRPVDRFDQLPAINLQDCLASDVEHTARLAFASTELERATIAGRDAAILTLTIEPTGASGSITLHAIGDTPLLALLDPHTGRASETLPLELTISGSDPATTHRVAVVQSRCDQHSVADDKKGTHFPIVVTTPTRAGELIVMTSERTRSELFAYLADVCGWG